MSKMKLVPLAISLIAASFLTGCLNDKTSEVTAVKSEVKNEVVVKNENSPVTAEKDISKPIIDQALPTNINTDAVISQELPADFFAPLVEKQDYIKVKVDPTNNFVEASYDKPVIFDFFWYGCGHCNAMRPLISPIIKSHPDFKSVKYPAAFSNWESGTKIFLTYQNMGLLDRLHDLTFNALHTEHKNLLGNKEQLDTFLTENKVDVAKYHEFENGFQMSRELNKAKQITEGYDLQSTPNFGVYYKGYAYMVNPTVSKGYENTARSLNMIISKFTPEQIKGN